MARRAGLSELGDLLHAFDEVLDQIPEARERALEAAEKAVRKELESQIVAKLPGKDQHGHVREWQETTFGDKGGYVKIKPEAAPKPSPITRAIRRAGKYLGVSQGEQATTRDITRYLERGHKLVRPGRNRYKRIDSYTHDKAIQDDRSGNEVVQGFQFYSWTKLRAVNEARKAAEIVLEEIEDTLSDT